MAEDREFELKAISELKRYTFVLPYMQRGYRWRAEDVERLLDDLEAFINQDEQQMYCLQPIAVQEREKDNKYALIDGQQRLTTIYLLHKYLVSPEKPLDTETELYHYEYERDEGGERKEFLQNVDGKIKDSKIDFFYISTAYKAIEDWFEGKAAKKDEFKKLLEASPKEKSVQILWYKVPGEGDANEVFRNLNSGKIQLTNTDLIKALLLNRTNTIPNREHIAAQFEQMERQFDQDRFWYMLRQKDIERQKGQTRMDLLFNLVFKIKEETYAIEPRSSFFDFSKLDDEKLLSRWKEVRERFQRIQDIFDDPYTFHYVGFLNYCKENNLKDILDKYAEITKTKFKDFLKEKIKNCLGDGKRKLEDFCYGETEALRRIFVLHNIETILHRYKQLQDLGLRFSYEHFPFELLYKQHWDIEHISSRTANTLMSPNDRKAWVDSFLADHSQVKEEVRKLKDEAEAGDFSDDKKFKELYEAIIKEVESDSIDEGKKDGIGNLVLLDGHKNRSFKNSLFPQKRKIVIIASGLRHTDKTKDEEDVKPVYVPLCTQQVYTKAYNKGDDVKLNSWTEADYGAYCADMKEKLAYYFGEEQND